MRALLIAITAAFPLLTASCATPEPATATQSLATKTPPPETTRRDDAELVTGSRIPVRGAQPVRTIDKDEITRNTSVIGVPAKGN